MDKRCDCYNQGSQPERGGLSAAPQVAAPGCRAQDFIRTAVILAFSALLLGLALPGCDLFSSDSHLSNVNLRPATAAELEDFVKGQKGRVVLIDFWATWCPPCRQLFPHSMALQKTFASRGLTVLTVSLDDPDKTEAVKSFLSEHDAQTMNFIARADDQGMNQFKQRFGLGDSIPFLVIFDRQGNLRKPPIVGADEAAIDSAVSKLLAEK